jgi:hypothetical protein
MTGEGEIDMKNWKAYLIIAAVIVAIGSVLGGVLSEPVVAQVRAALIKDVDSPARQPFAVGTTITDFAGGSNSLSDTVLTVPAGKRAVVEHVSCINYIDTANNWIRFEMRYTSAGAASKHQFVHTYVGPSFSSGIDIWSFSQPVRAYADPSTTITIAALRRSGSGAGGIECYVSGHYVDNAP